ncbi:MAG TPA: prenyltransferase/squalene oxidase repeat-containing protein, partial [Pirellulales bacterium]|nr:prenyltransferase/squalene oxidase repeat-containing protein [Pirellulales bacterium]
VLLPNWFPVNLYAMSSWSRTIVVPLAIMAAHKPVKRIDPRFGIRELFFKRPENWPPLRCVGLKGGTGLFSWDRFFRSINAVIKVCEQRNWLPLRRRALAKAERWMVDRFTGSDGLGAIFPPMIFSIIALRCLGYRDDSPELRYCYERLEGLFLEEDDTLRLQPCKSPVWDTSITLRALDDAGVAPDHPAVMRAVDWLLRMQIAQPGDWSETVNAEPGGWCFEHANDFYPDLDDTAMVVMSLVSQYAHEAENQPRREVRLAHDELFDLSVVDDQTQATLESDERRMDRAMRAAILNRLPKAIVRAEQWMLAMQNRDGGWAAFDRNNDRQFLCYVPFADHNAMTDPSTPDLTARVLEALGMLGHRVGSPAVDRAVEYLRKNQEADGSWFGRWGVNYIYGTWQVLIGLNEVGVPHNDPCMVAGANWLVSCQQPSGAWGESANSYDDPRLKGQGPATASQTAWAILGLLAAGRKDDPAVARGIRWLVHRQRDDGTWDEPEFTGTGFPRVFYLRYHMYPMYFPLMALSRWAARAGTGQRNEGSSGKAMYALPLADH